MTLQEAISGANYGWQVSGTQQGTHIFAINQPGTHTLYFMYKKDGSSSGGSDTVWIDNLKFPEYCPEGQGGNGNNNNG